MAALTPSELLAWLADNQFLPLPQVEEIRGQLASFADSKALVKELIRRNWLTPFQANQILTDKAQVLVLGQYRLLERLGEGAMGQVFKAWDVRLGRFVAVKMIHKDYLASAKAMDRFAQEMEAAASLRHPNIVLVRNAGETERGPFMVMDFFEATTLAHLVRDEGPLPVQRACDYVRQAALGLQNAFEHGVVHRDLKPGNLLLTRGNAEEPGMVKILDFGLGRSVNADREESRLTQVGRIIGTVDFISPEQVENAQKADVRSDIYSLGCTLYYLLTGGPPFPGAKLEDKIYGRLLGSPPLLRKSRSDVPEELDTVLQRIMARRPEDRYQTPVEVAQALEPFAQPAMAAASVAVEQAATFPLVQPVAPPANVPEPLAQVPLARPVTASGANVPVARPVAVVPPAAQETIRVPEALSFASPEPGEEVPFAFSNQAHIDVEPVEENPFGDAGAMVPAGRSGRTSRSPARKRSSGKMVALALLVVLVAGGWFLRGTVAKWLHAPTARRGVYPGGSLRVVGPAPLKMKEGERKYPIVRVERKGFSGPVKVQLKNLPEGVRAEPLTIAEDRDSGAIPVTVSFGSGAMKRNLKVLATAEELEAEDVLPLTVVPR